MGTYWPLVAGLPCPGVGSWGLLLGPLIVDYALGELSQDDFRRGGVIQCSDSAQRTSLLFTRIYAGVSHGVSAKDLLQQGVSPALTKQMVKKFTQADPQPSPLHTLRRVQVEALGGESWVADAACASQMGTTLGDFEEEAFAQTALQWVCTHQATLQEPFEVTTSLDYLSEMHRIDPAFACSGRTPKTVAQSMEAYMLTTVKFEDDAAFEINPRGISGFWQEDTCIPAGTTVSIPYVGKTEVPDRFSDPSSPYTVRISEILSLKRLIYEGQQLGNCLQDRRDSQMKYIQRARQRSSSFWSLTFVRGTEVEYQCLIEVWHLRRGNIIHQRTAALCLKPAHPCPPSCASHISTTKPTRKTTPLLPEPHWAT
ncbi:hypothetical protein CYMTET_15604 [Cymbomonas tetramitiformis]|uniref:Uncharacterized protein n=1 Tax=Cymbomonas tetramitiformis TaxID=36881 RepID=A0AAE0GE00_9CHLO|nr:hypothetical protein CYMTET_15604 [Cymbomonas tetramitiformis]